MKFDFRESLAFALLKAFKAHLRAANAGLAAYGLQVGQDLLLFHLWAEDGLTQSELVRRLEVEPPTLTRALRRLQRIGLVTRTPDPVDARALRVHLTAAGRRLEESVSRVWTELDALERTALGDAEHRLLRELALQLRGALAQARLPRFEPSASKLERSPGAQSRARRSPPAGAPTSGALPRRRAAR